MCESRLVALQVAIVALAIVVQGKVLVVVAEMSLFSRLAKPVPRAGFSHSPMRKCRLVKFECFGNVSYHQIQMLQTNHSLSPLTNLY